MEEAQEAAYGSGAECGPIQSMLLPHSFTSRNMSAAARHEGAGWPATATVTATAQRRTEAKSNRLVDAASSWKRACPNPHPRLVQELAKGVAGWGRG